MSPGVERRLGTADAAVLGLAAMIGTGVFAVWGPAAAVAGRWLLFAVVLAAVAAACNAASTADCAAQHPQSGGYGCGRALLGPAAGRLAGVANLAGKSAAAAAAAGVFGSYVLPSASFAIAVLAIAVVTALNIAGVRWTVRGAYALVGGTIAVLLLVVAVGIAPGGAAADPAALATATLVVGGGPSGVLTAAGLLFFAFAGYARIATLGEETRDPRRTIRWALVVALGVALVVYLLVGAALLVGMGAQQLAGQPAPLATLVDTRGAPGLGVLVRVGAAVAAGSALLSVLVGVSRTACAMARGHDLPVALARIGPRGTSWRVDLAGGVVAAGVAAFAGPAAAIAISACSLLIHSALVNLAALRLDPARRSWPRWTSVVGLVLCLLLALLLPLTQVLITVAVLAVGWTASTLLPHRE